MATGNPIWLSYISNKAVDFSNNFLMSFNAELGDQYSFLLGIHGTGKPSTQASISSFTSSVQRVMMATNDINNIGLGGEYEVVGNYIAKKTKDNTNFFGLKVWVYEKMKKVYEEVKDISGYDRNNEDYTIQYNTLYTFIPNKYVILSDGRVGLNYKDFPASMFYFYKSGVRNAAYYYTDDTFRKDNKFRLMMSHTGRIMTLSTADDKNYKTLHSFLNTSTLNSGYVLFGTTQNNVIKNISVNGVYV